MKFCGGCGASQAPGDLFCQRCGRAYSTDERSEAPEELPVVPSSSTENPGVDPLPGARWAGADDQPFPAWAPVAAGVAVFVAPFISLIVSLVMRSSEQRESRRSFLKNWAIASGAWLCTGFVIVIAVIASVTSHSHSGVANGKCKDGPDTLTPPSYISQTGKHWTAIVSCIGGGSITRPATKSEQRFLNSH